MQIDMDSDGMRVDLLEETLDRIEAEGRRPKFIYTVPSFQNPGGRHDVAAAAQALVRDRGRARAAGAGGQPVRPAALRGRGAAAAVRARRRRLRDVPRHLLEDPLAGIRLGLGVRAAARAGEDQPGQAGRRPVHLHAVAVDGPGLLRARRLARVRAFADRGLPRPAATPCWTRSRSSSRPGRVDPPGGRHVHLGQAAGFHRHHRPAGARAARQRGVRARRRRPSSTAAAPTRCA